MGRSHDKSKPRQVSTAAKKSEKAVVLDEGELDLNRVQYRCRAQSRSSQLKQTRLEDHKDKQIMPQTGAASSKTETSGIMVSCSSRQKNSAKDIHIRWAVGLEAFHHACQSESQKCAISSVKGLRGNPETLKP